MVVVAQLVRVSVCGTEGRGFESRLPPKSKSLSEMKGFFCGVYLKVGIKKLFRNEELFYVRVITNNLISVSINFNTFVAIS